MLLRIHRFLCRIIFFGLLLWSQVQLCLCCCILGLWNLRSLFKNSRLVYDLILLFSMLICCQCSQRRRRRIWRIRLLGLLNIIKIIVVFMGSLLCLRLYLSLLCNLMGWLGHHFNWELLPHFRYDYDANIFPQTCLQLA